MTSYSEKRIRIIVGVLLGVALFVLPSLLTLILGALLTLRFPRYFEFAGIAFMIDALYSPYGRAGIGLFGFALVFVVVVDVLRERIRVRDDRRLHQ